LLDIAKAMTAEHDLDSLLRLILSEAVRVVGADRCTLWVVDRDRNELWSKVAQGLEKEQIIRIPIGVGIAGQVASTGKVINIPDAYADPRFFREADKRTGFRTRSILCVPLARRGKEIGVLQVLNPIKREAFDEPDLAAFEAYGNLAATAIDKLRTIERQREQQRIDQEFAFARDIQTSFLPRSLPEHERIRFAATYLPARSVGGDFYDVIEMRPGQFFFVIGDVSGKGTPAALLMAQALSILRLILQPRISPATALARWNDMLCGRTIRGMFITALLGRIDVTKRTVVLASAGHCHPLRVSREGRVREITVPGGPPLGIVPRRTMPSMKVRLRAGEWFVGFTDGLVESFNSSREPMDLSGVEKVLAKKFRDAADVIDALERGELKHRGKADPHDDLTILVFGFR
jgi:sigma-B regulation protein RsbU (phosphoserine phosphatase)